MPRKETGSKIGPRSGRISPTATLHPQSEPQIYRVYNTGAAPCQVLGFIVNKACSGDFELPSNTTTTLGTAGGAGPKVEAVYELLPSAGLRSGRFKKPGAANTIIKSLGKEAIYRFFNTRKTDNAIRVTVGGTPHDIASKCSKDIFIDDSIAVTVGNDDEGVYDFLSFNVATTTPEGSVRSGHFKGNAEMEILRTGNRAVVYRLLNAATTELAYKVGDGADQSLGADSSCDIQIPGNSSLTVKLLGAATEFQGSYELLKIN